MDREINIKDLFKIDDSHSNIRGFVVIRDENGKILVKKENMIVKSGRQMILNALDGTSFKLKDLKAYLSTDNSLTTPDSVYTSNEGFNITESKITIDTENLTCHFELKYAPEANEGPFYSLMLVNGETLFSRVVFNGFEVSQNSTLTINYYIYF